MAAVSQVPRQHVRPRGGQGTKGTKATEGTRCRGGNGRLSRCRRALTVGPHRRWTPPTGQSLASQPGALLQDEPPGKTAEHGERRRARLSTGPDRGVGSRDARCRTRRAKESRRASRCRRARSRRGRSEDRSHSCRQRLPGAHPGVQRPLSRVEARGDRRRGPPVKGPAPGAAPGASRLQKAKPTSVGWSHNDVLGSRTSGRRAARWSCRPLARGCCRTPSSHPRRTPPPAWRTGWQLCRGTLSTFAVSMPEVRCPHPPGAP